MTTTKTVLVSIAGAWAGSRNVGNFAESEREVLYSQIEAGNVETYHSKGSEWTRLTEKGLSLLYELNGRKES